MLRSVKDLEKCTIGATDGDIGSVQDFYFDDQQWVIRYLVVKTGTWLLSRKVLISPCSILDGGSAADVVPTSLTQEQVKNSPSVDTDQPVSRQYEKTYYNYYGYPYYWGGMGLWGGHAYPMMMMPSLSYKNRESEIAREQREQRDQQDHHLRSCNAVSGYHLHAADGEIGHVSGYLIDEKSWAIRFLIVDTSNWWLGHQVLVASEWIASVDWAGSSVTTDLSRQAVKNSPAYDPQVLPDVAGEKSLYSHYERPAYTNEAARARVA
ncbi:MAG: PRC-barrel domain-containing protein [Steroidobacteraceae bacterium]